MLSFKLQSFYFLHISFLLQTFCCLQTNSTDDDLYDCWMWTNRWSWNNDDETDDIWRMKLAKDISKLKIGSLYALCEILSWSWFIPHLFGHIGPHCDAICQELPPLLPPSWASSFAGLCWLCSSSSFVVDLVLSCILVPPSTTLAVVCAGDTFASHVQASEVVLLSVWL